MLETSSVRVAFTTGMLQLRTEERRHCSEKEQYRQETLRGNSRIEATEQQAARWPVEVRAADAPVHGQHADISGVQAAVGQGRCRGRRRAGHYLEWRQLRHSLCRELIILYMNMALSFESLSPIFQSSWTSANNSISGKSH